MALAKAIFSTPVPPRGERGGARRWLWAGVLAALLVVWSPGEVLAQAFVVWSPNSRAAGDNEHPAIQTVNDGRRGPNGETLPTTVTMQVNIASGTAHGADRTFAWQWEQVVASAYTTEDGPNGTENNVNGGLFPSSHPHYVQLMNTSDTQFNSLPSSTVTNQGTANDVMGSVVLAGGTATPGNIVRPRVTFLAPDVTATTMLYFRARATSTPGAAARARFFRITIFDNNTPPLVDVSGLSAMTVDAGGQLTVSLADNVQNGSISEVFQLTGPTAGFTFDAATQMLVITAPDITSNAVMNFVLTTLNSERRPSGATLTVRVTGRPSGSSPVVLSNTPPVANAAVSDATVTDGERVLLDASGSSDADGNIVSWVWVQTAGTSQLFGSYNEQQRPRLRAPAGAGVSVWVNTAQNETLTFRLIVTDDQGASSYDEVDVAVTGASNAEPVIFDNDLDIRVRPGDETRLFISAYDPEGASLSYQWEPVAFNGAPSPITLTDSTRFTDSPERTFTAPALPANGEDATYRFQVTVADSLGARSVATRDVIVTITPVLPTPPGVPASHTFTTDAGGDQIVAGGSRVTLDGQGSTGGGSFFRRPGEPVRATWRQVSGISVTLNPGCSLPICWPELASDPGRQVNDFVQTFRAPAATVQEQNLIFVLSRREGRVVRSDSVTVTIPGTGAASTISVDAGMDRPIARAVPTPTVTLTATASGGTAYSYQWFQVGGEYEISLSNGGRGDSVTFSRPNENIASNSATFLVIATETTTLETARDEVTISFPNAFTIPTAEAGDPQVVAEGATVTLSGTTNLGTSQGSRNWVQFGGPGVGRLAGTGSNRTFTAPQLAETADLFFSFQVTNTDGRTAVDDVRIRVTATNDPPTITPLGMIIEGGPLLPGNGLTIRGNSISEDQIVSMLVRFDDDGGSVFPLWDQTGGPTPEICSVSGASFPLGDPANGIAGPASLCIITPQMAADYTMTFTVTARDSLGASSTTETFTVSVAVKEDAPVVDRLDVVRIDPGATLDLGTPAESVRVLDPEGLTVTYQWQQVSRTPLTHPDGDPCGGFEIERTLTNPSPGVVVHTYTPVRLAYTPGCDETFENIPSGHADRVQLNGATFTAPRVPRAALYFRLTASDPGGLSASAIRQVIVRAIPSANAGLDEVAFEGAEVTLDGTATEDAVSVRWEQIGGPSVSLRDETTEEPTFTVPDLDAETVLSFRLTATDAMGRSSDDVVDVRGLIRLAVNAGAGMPNFQCVPGTGTGTPGLDPMDPLSGGDPCTVVSNPQVRDTLTVAEGAGVALTALPVDNAGSIAQISPDITYRWSQVSGAAFVNPSNFNNVDFAFTAPTPLTADATMVVRVTATWGGLTATGTTTITVTAATSPSRPTASVDTPQSATLGSDGNPDTSTLTDISGNVAEGAIVRLDGSGTPATAGSTLVYVWRQTSPAAPQVLRIQRPGVGSSSAFIYFTAPEVATDTTFTFSFTVLEQGGTASAPTFVGSTPEMSTVTVTAGENDAPTAIAGLAQTVNEGDVVTLQGSGTDPEGEALTYAWTREAAASRTDFPLTLSDPTSATPSFTVPNLFARDTARFSLVVTDARGLSSAPAYANVTIEATNDAPVVNAGPDQRVAEGSLVTLAGSGSDPEGQPISLLWTQVEGAVLVELSDNRVARPTFRTEGLLAEGDLVFSLLVRDDTGVAASDTVIITITGADNDAPVAEAGDSQTVVVGSVVRLDGTASRDPEGGALGHYWEQTSGATVVFNTARNTAIPRFTAPNTPGRLVFTLQVEDPAVAPTPGADPVSRTATDTVTINVRAANDDASLSGLALTNAAAAFALTPVFATATADYDASVGNGVTSLKVSAVVSDAAASAITSGTAADGRTALGIEASANEALVSGLQVGINNIRVRVFAEDRTTTQDYTLEITRAGAANANADLAALSLGGGLSITPAFDAMVTAYTATAPFGSKDNLQVVAVVDQDDAAVALGGTAADGSTALGVAGAVSGTPDALVSGLARSPGIVTGLTAGANAVTVTVTAPDGSSTKTYTITVTVSAAGSDATLSALSVTQQATASQQAATGPAVALSPAFASATTSYSADLLTTARYARVFPTATDSGAGISVTGEVSSTAIPRANIIIVRDGSFLVPVSTSDPTEITVRVVPENGDLRASAIQNYTLTLTPASAASTVNTLAGLDLSPTPTTALAPTFAAATTAYTATVPYAAAASGLQVIPELTHSGASISIEGYSGDAAATPPTNVPLTFRNGRLHGLRAGANTVRIGVLSESNAGDNRRCPPDPAADVFGAPAAATCGSVFALTDANVNIYTVTVTVEAAGTDATLSALSLDAALPVALNETFAAGTVDYTADVPNSIRRVTAMATATEGGASVEVTGGEALALGANTISIVVTSEDASATSTYTVTVTRARAANTNADLAALIISAPGVQALTPAFDPATTAYDVTLPYTYRGDVSVFATPSQAGASFSYDASAANNGIGGNNLPQVLTVTNNKIQELPTGETDIIVSVTPPDGSAARGYTVTVTINEPSTDATLSALTLGGGLVLSPAFDSAVTSYSTPVDGSILTLTATPSYAHPRRFVIAGTSPGGSRLAVSGGGPGEATQVSGMEGGANTIRIQVFAEDGAAFSTYTLTANVTIRRTFQVSVDNENTSEGGTVMFTVGFSAGSSVPDAGSPATVRWTLGGDVTSDDYSAPASDTGVLTFTGLTAQTVSVSIAQDGMNEGTEALTFTLSDGVEGFVSTTSGMATSTIAASDPIAVAITSTTPTVQEGAAGADGMASFTVTLSGGTRTADVLVPFTTSGTLAGADYEITAPAGATDAGGTLTFTADTINLSETITVRITGDNIGEPSGATLTITGTAPGSSGLRTVGTISYTDATETVTINDDDPITVSLADAADINEGATAVFAVSLSNPSSTATTVPYTVTATGGTAPPFTDAGNTMRGTSTAASNGSIEIAAGATMGNIEITANYSDPITGGTRTFTVVLGTPSSNGGGAISGSGTHSVVVTYEAFERSFEVAVLTGAGKTVDVDPATPGIQVDEGNTVYFSVSLMGNAPTADVTVAWAPSGDTVTPGATLTFTTANWQTAQEITVVALDDLINEAAEMLSVTLSGEMTTGGTVGITTPTASVTVRRSDDMNYSFTSSPSTMMVTETDDATVEVTFTVGFSGGSGGSAYDSITIPFTVTGTASSMDYGPSITEFAFGSDVSTSGTRSIDVVFTITGDNLNEPDETVVVVLGDTPTFMGTGGGSVTRTSISADTTRTITIEDDDEVTVQLTRSDSGNLNEGDTANLVMEVTGAELTTALSVNLALVGANTDVTVASPITVMPAAGNRAIQTFILTVDDDTENEPQETVTVQIQSFVPDPDRGAASVGTNDSVDLVINASDPVSFTMARMVGEDASAAVAEGGTMSFTVTRDSATGGAGTVAFSVAGTGITADDFDITAPSGIAATATGGDLSFAAGEASQTITLSISDDTVSEQLETLTVTGGAITFANLFSPEFASGMDEVSATIAESDPITAVLADATDISEGNVATFTVTLTDGSGNTLTSAGDVIVNYTPSAASGVNFTDITAASITIRAGDSTGDIQISADVDDARNSGTENITVTVNSVMSPTGGPLNSPAFSGSPQMVTVTYRTVPRTITAAVDTGSGKTVDRDTTTDGIQVNEGDTVYFSVTMSLAGGDVANAPTSDVTVDWAPNGDTSEITATAATLTFTTANYATAQEVTLSVTDDMINEAAGTVGVLLSNQSDTDTGLAQAASVTIQASDPATYSIDDVMVAEGDEGDTNMLLFTVTLSAASAGNVMIPWSIATTGTATAGTDYTAPAVAPLSIATGATTAEIEVAVLPDAVNEPDETVIITLGEGVTVGAASGMVTRATAEDDYTGTGTITEDDAVMAHVRRTEPGNPAMTVTTGNVMEGSSAAFTVSLLEGGLGTDPATSAGAICVPVDVVVNGQRMPPNTADSGADIALPAGSADCAGAAATLAAANSAASLSVEIPAGESMATITIATRFDNLDEGAITETLSVTLGTPVSRAGAGTATASTDAATAPIENVNALRTLAVSAASVTGSEDSVTAAGETAFVEFTVTMSGTEALVEALTVPFTLTGADGANLPGAASASGLARQHPGGDHEPDFGPAQFDPPGSGTATGQGGTITFPVGALMVRTVRVPLLQDSLSEGAEMLTLTLTDPCPAPPAVCRAGGAPSMTGPDTPTLRLTGAAQSATIAASDPIDLRITRVGDAIVRSGDTIEYQASFGTTTVNGQSVPIRVSMPLTLQANLVVDGVDSGQTVELTATPGQSTATGTVDAATLARIAPSGTPVITLSTVREMVPTGGTPQPNLPDLTVPTNQPDLPDAVQTSSWTLSRALPTGDRNLEAPEGSSYSVTFTLEGTDTLSGLSFGWVVSGSASAAGGPAAVAGDFNCGTLEAPSACVNFPAGTLTFTQAARSQTLTVQVLDDGTAEGDLPEGFTLTFQALAGANAADVLFSPASAGEPLQVEIPALRVDLSIADATAAEGESAVFALTLSEFNGGNMTTQDVVVSYRVGLNTAGAALFPATDSAQRGVDYSPPEVGEITIPLGATAATVTNIEIPLLLDGVLEPRERFTITITGARGGGGNVRLSNRAGEIVGEISATGTITDDADQAARRRERVGILVSVLDRQTAVMATEAITARLERSRAGGGAQLSIANRNLLGAPSQSEDSSALGLALYGAAGMGGAQAGLPGVAGGGRSGSGGARSGAGGGADAFAGLGAGLAGGANMGRQTRLPSLSELMNGSSFNFQAAAWPGMGVLADLADGVGVWGSAAAADLSGNPRSSGASLDYDGDSIGAFIGADRPVRENLLVGLALGWSSGDLDFTDTAGDFTMTGNLTSDTISVHPYLGWQITPNINSWLVVGFGMGDVDVEESEPDGDDTISRKLDGADSSMRMISAGISGRQALGAATDLKLRLALTRVQSRVDSDRFDDNALLPKVRGRSLRAGAEAEVGHRISFANGISLRPFGSMRLRLDNTGTVSTGAESGIENKAFDVGGGLAANWPEIGLDGRFAVSVQLSDTGHEEHRASVNLNYDFGADSEGLTMAVQTALTEKRGGLLNATSGLSGLGGGSSLGGALSGGLGKMERSIKGEFGYGVAFRQFGRTGLLTPYGRFDLGQSDTLYATGLRLEAGNGMRIGLEAGLSLDDAARAAAKRERDFQLLLKGQLRF